MHDPQVGFTILHHFLWAKRISVYQTSVWCGSSVELGDRGRRRTFVVDCSQVFWVVRRGRCSITPTPWPSMCLYDKGKTLNGCPPQLPFSPPNNPKLCFERCRIMPSKLFLNVGWIFLFRIANRISDPRPPHVKRWKNVCLVDFECDLVACTWKLRIWGDACAALFWPPESIEPREVLRVKTAPVPQILFRPPRPLPRGRASFFLSLPPLSYVAVSIQVIWPHSVGLYLCV